jgi:hypothetical protein
MKSKFRKKINHYFTQACASIEIINLWKHNLLQLLGTLKGSIETLLFRVTPKEVA